MGIMTGVMDAVTTSAQQAGATRVLKVSLSVGEMTEAIEDALMFAFEALSEGTLCEDAELQITMVKPKSRCLECGAEYEHDRFHMLCPECGSFATELIDGPGSGKTSTILATIDALRDEFNIAVIEGDIASSVDAEKIKAQGIAAVQINTGGACHLESAMIKRAVDVLDLERLDLIIVENVGNLVCPTDFDLGENAKVMILSVPEGDDKPLKYPGVFQVAEAVVLNKVDTMPVFNFDREAFEAAVTQLNPQAPIFPIAATKGDGVDAWAEWLANRIRAV